MQAENSESALVRREEAGWLEALGSFVVMWVENSTRVSGSRRRDVRRDKRRAIEAFFASAGKRPAEISAADVQNWQAKMERDGLAANTIYTRLSFLSSFYNWAIKNAPPGEHFLTNPVLLARPKRPRPYQTKATKALDDEDLKNLVDLVRKKAGEGSLVAKRDFALLLWYLVTGMRRAEVIGLRGGDIQIRDERILVRNRVKGGFFEAREIIEPELRAALLDYLTASDRLHSLKSDAPIWTRHDVGGKPGDALSSHSFVRNLKQYAREAGLKHIHLHQTRHTFARIVAEETGSLIETQEALGHESPKTTRVYVQRIAIKKDRHGSRVARRWQQDS
jgi:integrase